MKNHRWTAKKRWENLCVHQIGDEIKTSNVRCHHFNMITTYFCCCSAFSSQVNSKKMTARGFLIVCASKSGSCFLSICCLVAGSVLVDCIELEDHHFVFDFYRNVGIIAKRQWQRHKTVKSEALANGQNTHCSLHYWSLSIHFIAASHIIFEFYRYFHVSFVDKSLPLGSKTFDKQNFSMSFYDRW